MPASAGTSTTPVTEIRFGGGTPALLTAADAATPEAVLARIGLPSGERPVIIACGGAGELAGPALSRTEAILGPAVAAAGAVTGAAVVDGGTASGVMAAMGDARAHRLSALPVLLGVAPEGKVSWPDGPAGDRAALEPHHTHFVLGSTTEWGGETGLLIDIAATLAGTKPVVMVLAGGGSGAHAEVLAAARRGWAVFVIEGTGGLADDVAAHWRRAAAGDRSASGRLRLRLVRGTRQARPGETRTGPETVPAFGLEEILTIGDIRPFSGDPRGLGRQLAWELQEEPVLKAAWHTFATYDHVARRVRSTFQWLQGSILGLGVLATLLALIQHEVAGPQGRGSLHWLVVIVPILVAALIAWSSRRADGQRWVMLRAAAEAVKSEIYRYRTRTEVYSPERPDVRGSTALQMRMLQAHLAEIDAKLVRTEASTAPLPPYRGALPPEMYGAGRHDDGLSPLNAERYLRIRVNDQIVYYHRRIRYLNRLRTALELLAIAAGAAGAIVAAVGADVWVGLTSGVAGATIAYLGYLQVENSIVAYNRAASNLASLARGWYAQSPRHRGPKALGKLVISTEEVLSHERAGWVHQMCEALQDLRARQQAAADKVKSDGTEESMAAADEAALP